MYIWCWCSTVDFSQRDKINFVHFVANEKEKEKKIPIPNEINVVFKKKNIEQDFIFLISCFLKPGLKKNRFKSLESILCLHVCANCSQI